MLVWGTRQGHVTTLSPEFGDWGLGTGVSALKASAEALYALVGGDIFAAGPNTHGQLGNVYDWDRTSGYISVGGGDKPKDVKFRDFAVSPVSHHVLSIGTNNVPYTWGANDYGQLGDDYLSPTAWTDARPPPPLVRMSRLPPMRFSGWEPRQAMWPPARVTTNSGTD